MVDGHPGAGPPRLRLVDDPGQRLLGQGRVGLVVEVEHPTSLVVVAHQPEEGRDGAGARAGDRVDHGVEREVQPM